MFERLAHWDAFVLPSRADPFPISMLEAMASGLPVVGTRRDGIAEQLADRHRPADRARRPAARSPTRSPGAPPSPPRPARGWAAAARERVDSAFTLAHQAAAMHEAYLATLANGARQR